MELEHEQEEVISVHNEEAEQDEYHRSLLMLKQTKAMYSYIKFPAILLLSASIFLSACENNTPQISQPRLLVTTVIYTLTPVAGGDDVILSYEDLDGKGGNPPSFILAPLSANTTYTGSIGLLNKTVSPAEDVGEIVAEKDEYHQFFFEVQAGNLAASYDDMDEDANPVGLKTTLSTGDPGSATLKIILRQDPDKSEDAVADGDITLAGGVTLVEFTFEINIE